MAQSVRGLRQSAVLCAREQLPLTMDLLQGSETVAAVLRRCGLHSSFLTCILACAIYSAKHTVGCVAHEPAWDFFRAAWSAAEGRFKRVFVLSEASQLEPSELPQYSGDAGNVNVYRRPTTY